MAHTVTHDVSNIIRVTFNGTVDLHERMLAVDEVCELVNSPHNVRLLIDVRNIKMDMSLDDQQYFGRFLASKQALANAKVALLHKPRDNPNIVINAVAYAEGYHVVEFDQLNEAHMWLKGDLF